MPINLPDLSAFAPPKFVPPTKDAEIHQDLQYSSEGHVRQRLDLYLPKPENRRQGATPVIVYIHGTSRPDSCLFEQSADISITPAVCG